VLNLGGIANLTLLTPHTGAADSDDHATPRVTGFDCGPGNALMDAWCQRHHGADWDEAGRWAAQGRVIEALLARMLAEPFFGQAPPKSTGRDLFHPDWLAACIHALGFEPAAADVQATLAELTATSAADAIRRHQPGCVQVLVCGGGARNTHVMKRLQALLARANAGVVVTTTVEAAGVPVDQVEALAFAWLGAAFKGHLPGNVPAVTGAAGPRRLGALHPAG
jgi:anhydro-N-acetylmuramic acid kinase